MSIKVNVIEDSISDAGKRLTTLQLRYPRIIHSELMTHRVFSRNASSSRAIPVEKIIAQVENDLAEPVSWGKNCPGMQAKETLDPAAERAVRAQWRNAAQHAVANAKAMVVLGAHKQIVNRILEPYSHISVVVTATEWANFFDLRCHEDADPTMRELAILMRDAMRNSVPVGRPSPRSWDCADEPECWHLPYVTSAERAQYPVAVLLRISGARCARVSYLLHDGAPTTLEKDLALFERLVGARPLHASPIEHQAHAMASPFHRSRNLRGWKQHRAIFECIK